MNKEQMSDLIISAKNMSVVLGKGPHSHQPMQCSRGLITMTRAKFGHS